MPKFLKPIIVFDHMTTQTASAPTWFRGFIQGKTRIMMAWIFAAILVFSARQYPTFPGIIVCFLGASLRFWASGFLRKDSKPAVGGPYTFTRNPLYLGTYLMALGSALSIENYWLLWAVSVIFFVLYHYRILDEETKLARIFGEPYSLYCKAVNRFVPRITPASRILMSQINSESEAHQFNWKLATRNRAFEAYYSFLGLIGFIYLVAHAWQFFDHS